MKNLCAWFRRSLSLLSIFPLLFTSILFVAGTLDVAAAGFTTTGVLKTARQSQTATLLPNGTTLVAGGRDSSGASLASAEVFDPATGVWSSASALLNARARHTATMLPGGKVLVVGGVGAGGSPLATAELYDPTTGAWSATGALSMARASHTATLLGAGQVLVVGGDGSANSPLASAEVYDPVSGSWSNAGVLNAARESHAANLLPLGQILVTGGVGSGGVSLNSCEIYDPTTGAWTIGPVMAATRSFHTATTLSSGQVLVVGGLDFSAAALSSAELYDPAAGTWVGSGSLTTARSHHSANLLPDGKLLAIGGRSGSGSFLASAEVYDPASGIWASAGALTGSRADHTANVLAGGQILVAGGSNGSAVSGAELYDSAGGSWTATGSLQYARHAHVAAVFPNGTIAILGGGNFVGEVYDPAQGAWTLLPVGIATPVVNLLPDGKLLITGSTTNFPATLYDPVSGAVTSGGDLHYLRNNHSAVTLQDGSVILFGGVASSGASSSVELYDVASSTWSLTGSIINKRLSHTANLLNNGQVLAAGGFNYEIGYLSACELYDPATKVWSSTGSLNTKREQHASTLLPDGKVLVSGGFNIGGSFASAEIYNPASGLWTVTGAMSGPRYGHASTLLPNGKVLVTGGSSSPSSSNSVLATAEFYDPATAKWSPAPAFTVARCYHTATLLPDGRLLIAGGTGAGADLASAEIYDPAQGADGSRKPQISSATSPIRPGNNVVLNGSNFGSLFGNSSGNSQDSTGRIPVVQLRSLESGRTMFFQPDPVSVWSATSFHSTGPSGFPRGYAYATVFANGISGASAVVSVDPPPVLSSVVLTSSNPNPQRARAGDVITLSFVSNWQIQTPSVTIAGRQAAVTGDGTNWTATLTVAANDPQGHVSYLVAYQDLAGNAGPYVTDLTNGGSVSIDTVAPSIASAHFGIKAPPPVVNVGDLVKFDFQTSENVQTPTVTMAGRAPTLTGAGQSWHAELTIAPTDPEGPISISIAYVDLAGNSGPIQIGPTDNYVFSIDRTPPSLTSVSIKSSNAVAGYATTNNVITLTFNTSEVINYPTVIILGRQASVTEYNGTQIAVITVVSSDPSGVVPFSITCPDPAGNISAPVSATTDGTSVTVDKTPPSLTSVAIASNNAHPTWARIGDSVTLAFTSSKAIQTPTVTLAGRAATVTGSGVNWLATFLVGSADREGIATFSVAFRDLVGNAGANVTTTTDSSSVTIDRTLPVITTKGVNPVLTALNGVYTDAGATATDTASGSVGVSVSGTVDTTTQGSYTLTYSATDLAGNTATATRVVNVRPGFTTAPSLATARYLHTAALLGNGKVLIAGGLGSVKLASAELFDPSTGKWTAASSMATPRTQFTANLMPNGQLLVAGGFSATATPLSSIEVYDPTTGAWRSGGSLITARYAHTATRSPGSDAILIAGGEGTSGVALSNTESYDSTRGVLPGPSLNTARYWHTATLLPNLKVLVVGGQGAGGQLTSAEVYDPTAQTWTNTAPLHIARSNQTATLLTNGMVLVVGGHIDNYTVTNSAELYDPVAGTWSFTGSLATARSSHTATLLPNGTVLVTGGGNGSDSPISSAELYDPTTGAWTAVPALAIATRNHTATMLPTGEVLIAGGYGSSSMVAAAALYDASSSATWSTGPAMSAMRSAPTANLLPSGKLLLAGGYGSAAFLGSAELYAPATGAWQATGAMNLPRAQHTGVLLATGKVLVTGGIGIAGGVGNGHVLSSSEIYDPASEIWTTTGSMTAVRQNHTATLLANGKVLVAGGYDDSNHTSASAELYDPSTGAWSPTGSMATPRNHHTANLLANGKVLVTGGTTVRTAELYDPTTGTWSATGTPGAARSGHSATLLPNGKVLVAGGSNFGLLSSAELYDPSTGTWTSAGSLGVARSLHTAILLPGGQVLVSGGSNGAVLASAERYDPALGTWAPAPSLIVARYLHTTALLPSGNILVAGGDNGSLSLAETELYDPGLGFAASSQPQITGASFLGSAKVLFLNGARFRGISNASGGGPQDSGTNYPVVQLRSVESGQTSFLLSSSSAQWSTSSFQSTGVTGFPQGYALATVFANGIPSVSAFVNIDTTAPTLTAVSIASNNTAPGRAKLNDQITVNFTASELIRTPSVNIAGQAAAISGSGTAWTATLTVGASTAEGAASLALTFSDHAGNAGVTGTASTDGSRVIVDRTPPVISLIGANPAAVQAGALYIDPGATALDSVDGAVSVTVNGSVNLAAIGTYTLTYRAIDSAGNQASQIRTVNVTPPASVDAWKRLYFGAQADPILSGDLADPDGDGIPNLLEYAFATDPTSIETNGPFPQSGVVEGRLTLVFPRNPSAADLTLTVQGADSPSGPWTDLASSISGNPFTPLIPNVLVGESTDSPPLVQISDTAAIGDAGYPQRFLRVLVQH